MNYHIVENLPRMLLPSYRHLQFHSLLVFLCILAPCLLTRITPTQAAPPEVRIATEGKALLPVIVSPKASKEVRATAQTLAEYLGKISGGEFAVQEGNGAGGIVVGLPANFDQLPLKVEFPKGE